MPDSSLSDRFLSTIQRAYRAYVDHGPRSNHKLKILHGWVQRELSGMLGDNYVVRGISEYNSSEVSVRGKYYVKNVDIAVARNRQSLGVVSIKFVQSNYLQNRNNYFEQQLGETANLRRSDLVFGHIMVFTEPIPYFKRDGSIKKLEHVDNRVIQRYISLIQDHHQAHVPDVQCIAIFLLDLENKEIVRQCQCDDLDLDDSLFYQLEGKLGIERFFDSFVAQLEGKYTKLQV